MAKDYNQYRNGKDATTKAFDVKITLNTTSGIESKLVRHLATCRQTPSNLWSCNTIQLKKFSPREREIKENKRQYKATKQAKEI